MLASHAAGVSTLDGIGICTRDERYGTSKSFCGLVSLQCTASCPNFISCGCVLKGLAPLWQSWSLGSSLAHLDEDEDHVQADALQDVWQDLQHESHTVSQAAMLLHEAA